MVCICHTMMVITNIIRDIEKEKTGHVVDTRSPIVLLGSRHGAKSEENIKTIRDDSNHDIEDGTNITWGKDIKLLSPHLSSLPHLNSAPFCIKVRNRSCHSRFRQVCQNCLKNILSPGHHPILSSQLIFLLPEKVLRVLDCFFRSRRDHSMDDIVGEGNC